MYQERLLDSMALPVKREPPTDALHLPEPKRGKFVEAGPPQLSVPAVKKVVLNPADCDLDFSVKEDGLHGSALYEQGFAYCWSGARANVGINGGKYCFGCKIVAAQPVDADDIPLEQQHVCRLGISRGDDPVGNLGETLHSFGFGGTGKFSNAGVFSGYGEPFGVGDTVLCCVDLESKPMASIGFSKNGKWLGIAKQFDAGPHGLGVVDSPLKALPWESAVFPHVLLKNVVVQLQFSNEDGLVPQEGYRPWASAIEESKMILGPTFPNSSDCEVIMMVGLPASGKTTWAEKWVTAHPEKRYILLGTNLALDQMKVPGLHRKHNYGERFNRLMDQATGIFNNLLSRASKISRNVIIDQTNVYKSARKRKLKPFADYHKIAVVVFPKPEELKSRADKRFTEMGKEVPSGALSDMLANYTLPMSTDMHGTDEYFDEVWFPELTRDESQRHLDEMKANLRLNSSRQGSIPTYISPLVQDSRGKSVESYTSPSVQNQGIFAGVGGQWPSSYTLQPPIGASPISSYSAPFGNNFNQYEAYSVPPDYGRNANHCGLSYRPSSSPYLGSNFNQSETYSGHHHFGKNDDESRVAAQGSRNVLYPSYANTYSHPTVGSGNCLPGPAAGSNSDQMIEHQPRVPAFPYNAANAYTSQSPVAPDFLPTRPRSFMSTTPAPYGSPFGTPPPRPAYGSFPGDTQHIQGYGPPAPGYY